MDRMNGLQSALAPTQQRPQTVNGAHPVLAFKLPVTSSVPTSPIFSTKKAGKTLQPASVHKRACKTRKKQCLTDSQQAKYEARKASNKISAQKSRDKKKDRISYLEGIMKKHQKGWKPSDLHRTVTVKSQTSKDDIVEWLQKNVQNYLVIDATPSNLSDLADRLLTDRKNDDTLKALYRSCSNAIAADNSRATNAHYLAELEKAAAPYLLKESEQQNPPAPLSPLVVDLTVLPDSTDDTSSVDSGHFSSMDSSPRSLGLPESPNEVSSTTDSISPLQSPPINGFRTSQPVMQHTLSIIGATNLTALTIEEIKQYRANLESILQKHIPGWTPANCFRHVRGASLQDPRFVVQWLQQNAARSALIRAYYDQLPQLAKLLQGQLHAPALIQLQNKLLTACSLRDQSLTYMNYINSLEEAVEPFLLPDLQPQVPEASNAQPFIDDDGQSSTDSGIHSPCSELPDLNEENDRLMDTLLAEYTGDFSQQAYSDAYWEKLFAALVIPTPASDSIANSDAGKWLCDFSSPSQSSTNVKNTTWKIPEEPITPDSSVAMDCSPSAASLQSDSSMETLSSDEDFDEDAMEAGIFKEHPITPELTTATRQSDLSHTEEDITDHTLTAQPLDPVRTEESVTDPEQHLAQIESNDDLLTNLYASNEEMKARVLKDDRVLKHSVVNTEGYYVNDSMPYGTYAVHPDVRSALLSESLRHSLKTTKRANTGFFQFSPSVKNPEELTEAMQRATTEHPAKSKAVLGKAWLNWDKEDDLKGKVTLSLTKPAKKDGSYSLLLKEKEPLTDQETLALYNRSSEKSISVNLGRGKDIELKPLEGVFLQYQPESDVHWAPTGHYYYRKKDLDTNPLLRENGPLVAKSDSSRISNEGLDGEFFLNRQAIMDLASRQSAKTGKPVPSICMSSAELGSMLKKFSKSPQSSCSFITGCAESNHFISGRLIKSDGKIIVYLNETLKPDNEVTCQTQQMVLLAVGKQFPDNEIHFLTPGYEGQKDFSTCGVATLKTLKAFDKRPELDKWLITRVASEEEGSSSQVILKKGKGKGKDKEKDSYIISESSRIPLQKMNPWLLKLYQGKLAHLDRATQLDATVSHPGKDNAMTLEEYIKSYQKERPSLIKAGATSTPNLAGYCKRYKHLLTWEQMLAQPMESEPAVQSRSMTDEELHHKLMPLKKVGNRKEANRLLQESFPDLRPTVSKDMWYLMEDFEKLALGQQKMRYQQLLDVLGLITSTNLLDGDENSRILNELFKLWLEYIVECDEASPEWANLTMEEISAKIFTEMQAAEVIPSRRQPKRTRTFTSFDEPEFNKKRKTGLRF